MATVSDDVLAAGLKSGSIQVFKVSARTLLFVLSDKRSSSICSLAGCCSSGCAYHDLGRNYVLSGNDHDSCCVNV